MVEVDRLEVMVEADYDFDLVKNVVVRVVATRFVIVQIAVVKISAGEARTVRK